MSSNAASTISIETSIEWLVAGVSFNICDKNTQFVTYHANEFGAMAILSPWRYLPG